jgi:transcriptional regulator with XRE-family HTH domain
VTIGQEIRRLREEKGWSQAKLGVLSGVGPAGVSQIETGRRNPSAGTLQRIADALEVEVRDLFPLGQPRLPESEWWTLLPPGKAYFQDPEEGEEEDTVTLRINYVRLMDERDRLLQQVRELERENADLTKQLEKPGRGPT